MPFRSKLGQRALVENLESSDSVTVTRGSRNGPRASPAAEWGRRGVARDILAWVPIHPGGQRFLPCLPANAALGGARRSPARATGSSG